MSPKGSSHSALFMLQLKHHTIGSLGLKAYWDTSGCWDRRNWSLNQKTASETLGLLLRKSGN